MIAVKLLAIPVHVLWAGLAERNKPGPAPEPEEERKAALLREAMDFLHGRWQERPTKPGAL